MEMEVPPWATAAAALPIAFAQVREDPLLDEWVASGLPRGFTVAMVSSGGCTAAWLAAATEAAHVHLVDMNPAQIALTRLKLKLLEDAPVEERLRVLGHEAMPAGERSRRIARELEALGLPTEAIGPIALVGEEGPDHAGRYEHVFAALREEIALEGMSSQVEALCRSNDPADAARRADPTTPLVSAPDAAFARAMSLPILVRLFGEAATRNRVEPFAAHFVRRLRHVLATMPASTNAFLSQVLLGRYPPSVRAPWLSAPRPARLPSITWEASPMAEALRSRREEWHLVHLSNILDWLPDVEAEETLAAAWLALRPGGLVIIRQLNSTLDIRRIPSGFIWDAEASERLLARDRSYFYRAIHLGRKA
jgi:S-adenosylmethionine-diacylglycerol 3-amino-3-carboxypropyl transferase